MKICAALLLMTLMACPALAEIDRPANDLPVYPGGESAMEMNITNEELLPMLGVMLPLAAGKLGDAAEAINPDEIAAIFKDVRRMLFRQVNITKQGVTEQQITDFYSKSLPTGQWSRVFWQSKGPEGTVGIFMQSNAEMLYGFRVRTTAQDGKSVKRVEVAKIEGPIDFGKLMSLAGKFLAAKAGAK